MKIPRRLQRRIGRVTGVFNRRTVTKAFAAIGIFSVLVSMAAVAWPAPGAQAAINSAINFQGKLVNANGTNIPNGTYNLEFKLYTGGTGCVSGGSSPCGGTLQWTEDWLRNSSQGVTVTDGIFQVNLGSITSLPAIFNNSSIWMSINLGNTNATCTPFSSCAGDGEMLPFVRFTASPYAFNSDALQGLHASDFAQLSPGSAQSGFLNVTGNVTSGATVAAATSLQAPLVDTASAVALNVGTGTASQVNIGRTTTPFLVQGNSSSTFTATSGANTTTVSFTAPTANRAINFPDAGGKLCTDTASTCSATYQVAGSYLAKNATDTSSFAVTATNYLYGFTNSSSAIASGVLKLDNGNNTGSGLTVVGSGNPVAGQALILANGATGISGNLLDLQVNASSKFSVNQAGAVTTGSTINSQTISSAASFTGTVTAATSLLAPLVDTASAGVLSVGTTNATAINLNQNVNVAAGKNLTFTAGAGNFDQSASTGTNATGTGAVSLNGNTTVAANKSLTAGGSATFQDATNAVNAFSIYNQSASQALAVDTTADASNLVTNGDFEANTTGWSAKGGATLSQTTAQQLYAADSLQVAAAASGDGAKYPLTLSAGQQYTLAFYGRTDSATATFAFGYAFDGADEATYASTAQSINGTSWQRYTITFTPASISGTPYVFLKQTAGTARNIYIDGVTLATGSSPLPFREGRLSLNSTISSQLTVKPINDIVQAFQVVTSTNGPVFTVDTSNSRVGIGASPSTDRLYVTSGTMGTLRLNQTSTFNILDGQQNGTNVFTVASTGATLIQPSADGAAILQVKTNGGSNAFSVDTTGGTVAAAVGGTLTVATSLIAPLVSTVDGASASAALVVRSGNTTGGSGLSTGTVTIKSGDGTGTSTSTGNVTLDAGAKSSGGFAGNVYLGTANALNITVGRNSSVAAADATLLLSGTASTSKLILSDSTDANELQIGFTAPTAARTVTFADASGTVCLDTGNCSGANGYILNQSTANQTADFRISGSGRANTSILTPLLDTPSGVTTLSIGTTNATAGINLNQNTTIASGKSLTVQGNTIQSNGTVSLSANGASSFTTSAGALTLTAAAASLWGTSAGDLGIYANANLNLGNQGGTAINIGTNAAAHTIAVGTDATNAQSITAGSTNSGSTVTAQGGATKLSLANAGAAVRTGTSSAGNTATALQVQNGQGAAVLGVGTNDTNLIINPGAEVAFGSEWAAYGSNTTVARDTSNAWNGAASVSVVVTPSTAGRGAQNNLGAALSTSTAYTVSFYAKLKTGDPAFADVAAAYSRDGTAGTETACSSYNTQTVVSGGWTRVTCTFTSSGTAGNASAYIVIRQTAGAARTFYLDGVQLEQTSNIANAYGAGTLQVDAAVSSPIMLQNTENSTTALSVQNAAGTTQFVVDTLNSQATVSGQFNVGGTLQTNTITPTGTLTIGATGQQLTLQGNASTSLSATGGGFATTFAFTGTPSGAVTYNLDRAATAGTYLICTEFSGSCDSSTGYIRKGVEETDNVTVSTSGHSLLTLNNGGSGSTSVLTISNGSGLNSALSVSSAANVNAGNATILASNTLNNATGNLLDLQSTQSATLASRFAVDMNGNATQAGGTSTTDTLNGQRISSAANFTGTVIEAGALTVSAGGAGITGNSSVTGTLGVTSTISATGTGAAELIVSGAPAVSNASSLVQIGGAAISSGSANGTYIGLNTSGATTADLLNLENNNTSEFKVTSAGVANATTGFSVGGTGGTSFGACGAGQYVGSFQSSGGIVIGGSCTALPSTSGFLLKNQTATETSSGGVAGDFYDFTNTNSTSAANVLTLTNDGSGNTLKVTSAINPASGNALIFASDTNAAPSGNLLDLQAGAAPTSRFAVDTSGNLTLAGNIDSAAGISIGASTATSVTLGKSTTTVKINGTAQIGNAAGSGAIVNNGSTTNTVLAIGDTATGNIGASAAATVDIYTYISVAETTASQSLTLFTPSASTTYGKVLYLSNIGTASFGILGSNLSPGSTATLIWANKSGGAAWTFAGASATSLQQVYNNTSTSPVSILTTSVAKTLAVQAGATFDSSSLLQVQDANGAQLFNIDTTNPITDLTNNANNNLVTNGSFESTTAATGWAKMGASQVAVAQDSTQQYIGYDALKVLTTATAADGAKFTLTTSTLVSNTKYTLTLYAKTNVGSSFATFEIGHADNGATNTSCLTAQTVISGGWTQYTCSFTTGTTSSTPYIYAMQTNAAIHTYWIDGVSLTRFSLLGNASVDIAATTAPWAKKLGTETTTAQSATQHFDGADGLQIVTTATANQGAKQNITLNDSTMYTLTFEAINTGAAFTDMEAGYSSVGGTTDDTPCITAQTVTAAFTAFTCTFTTPSSHSGTPYFYVKQAGGAVHTFYIDAVQLSIGNPLTAYQEGKLSLGGIINSPAVFQNQVDSTTAFMIQSASGNTLFNVDTFNDAIRIGDATNYVQFTAGTREPVLNGTARHTKNLILTAEFAGAVLDGDGTSNLGTMTAAFEATQRFGYYKWVTGQGTAQDYDIVATVPVPDDYSSWTGTPTFWAYGSAGSSMSVTITDTAGVTATNYNASALTVSTTWTARSVATPAITGTYTQGSNLIIRIHMTAAATTGDVRLGTITLPYLTRW